MENSRLERIGITRLNKMQQTVYDTFAGNNKDIIVLSPTGTGKTLAYLLPLLNVIDKESNEVQAVVVVPGRELALQSHQVLSSISDFRSCACYGGRMTMHEHKQLKEKLPQIIFATPGRLIDHVEKGNINPTHISYLIIDEFDKCMNMGFEKEMSSIISLLPYIKRRILLSATQTDRIGKFIYLRAAVEINFLQKTEERRIETLLVKSETKDKLETLLYLLGSFGNDSAIVFLNYRESVERTAQFLTNKGFIISAYHGGLEQEDRERTLYKFTNGSTNILVCTDLASRGLDIDNVKHIVHYHLPETQDTYTHRIGRTARWDKTGQSYFILGPEEYLPEYVDQEVPEYLIDTSHFTPSQPKMSTLYIGKGKNDKISKTDILGFLCKKGALSSHDIGQINVFPRYAYVAINRAKVRNVLAKTRGEKIKGLKTIIEEIK